MLLHRDRYKGTVLKLCSSSKQIFPCTGTSLSEGRPKLCHSGHSYAHLPGNTVDPKDIVIAFLRTEVTCGTGTLPWSLLIRTCETLSPPLFQFSIWSWLLQVCILFRNNTSQLCPLM